MLAARLRSLRPNNALNQSRPAPATRALAAPGVAVAEGTAAPFAPDPQPRVAKGDSPARRLPRRKANSKPFLVRVAGRTSDAKAAAGAVVKRLASGAVRWSLHCTACVAAHTASQ